MSKAKWCKGKELHSGAAWVETVCTNVIYMNGRIMPCKMLLAWDKQTFKRHTWHRAIPLVHEKELINRVLTYTKIN